MYKCIPTMRQGLYTVLITTSSYHFSQKKEGVSNTVVSKLLGEKMLVVQSLQNNTNHTIVSYLKKEKKKKKASAHNRTRATSVQTRWRSRHGI